MRFAASALLLCTALVAVVVPSSQGQTAGEESGDVLVIGDSLAVGTGPYLRRALASRRVRIDAEVGRSSTTGVGLLRSRLKASDRVVVFDLGTNDDPSQPSRLAGALRAAAEVAGDRCLVVATINRPPYRGVSTTGLNSVVERFAAESPNAQLADWRAQVAARPGLLYGDGVHPKPAGYSQRGELVAQAVEACGAASVEPVPESEDKPAPAPPRRPRKPKRPVIPLDIVLTEPFDFLSRGVRLRGQLMAPTQGGPHPAVVLLPGSGSATREDMRSEARHLARRGFAALAYDKRGAGRSGGDADHRYDELQADARAAVRALSRRPDVRRGAIALWGRSEAASIAPLAAAGNELVAAVVAVSPSALPPATRRGWAVRRGLYASGARHGMGAVTSYYRVASGLGDTPGVGALAPRKANDLSFRPTLAWRRVTQPVLATWGTEDELVPIRESAAALGQALEEGSNRDREFRVFAGADHDLVVRSGDGRARLAPGFLQDTTRWLSGRLSRRPPRPRAATPLPPSNTQAVPVVAGDDASLLDRPAVQLAWLLIPALLVGVAGVGAIRSRREPAGAPRPGGRRLIAVVLLLDLAGLAGLALALAGILSDDGRGVAIVAGLPATLAGVAIVGLLAALATAMLARRAAAHRRDTGAASRGAVCVCAASVLWLGLLAQWLV